MTALPTRPQMLRAFLDGDRAAEGIFIVAVRTTGIFCRPTCPARKPKVENVEFYPTARDALLGGYRPCKRCRPMDVDGRVPALVERLRMAVEADPTGRIAEKDLAGLGIDASTARRQFRKYLGMTFHAYQRSRRIGLAHREVREGRGLLAVGLDHGYESASGFRDAFARVFGAPPSAGDTLKSLVARWVETPLGPMLALADDDGLHVLDFADRKGLERKVASLKAAVVPGDHPHLDAVADGLAAYFAGTKLTFDVPLAPEGTPWQRLVWDQLAKIPVAETRSYAWMAVELGRPTSTRAVGNANGLNYLSIVIPCHRVISADGTLRGYGGGLWRKQWLLDHERKHRGIAPDRPTQSTFL